MNKVDICPNCNSKIVENANFCSSCGMGLTPMAKELRKLESENAQLIMLGNIVTMLKNKQDIMIIKNLVTELKNKKI